MFTVLCRWEVGVRLAMVIDDWETFRLDNLESEEVGGACGAPESICLFSPQIKPKHLPTSKSMF